MDEREVFFGNGTRSYASYSLPSRTSTSTTAGSNSIFLLVCVVCPSTLETSFQISSSHIQTTCVTRPWEARHGIALVILRSLVFISNQQPNWCTQGDAKLRSRLYLNSIFLISGCCKGRLARPSSSKLRLYVGFRKLHSWRTAVDNASY